MIYIGIDNGISGGLVALSDHAGVAPIAKTPMPVQGKSKGNEVSVKQLWLWLSQWKVDDLTVLLETPGKHSPGVNAIASMWDSYGAIRGLLESRYIRHHRVTPQTWQKWMLPGCEKGQTKPMALSVCSQLWPNESWMARERSSKPHEGLIDAALIAEYGRRKGL